MDWEGEIHLVYKSKWHNYVSIRKGDGYMLIPATDYSRDAAVSEEVEKKCLFLRTTDNLWMTEAFERKNKTISRLVSKNSYDFIFRVTDTGKWLYSRCLLLRTVSPFFCKYIEEKNAENKTENKTTENKTAENKIENKTAENKTTLEDRKPKQKVIYMEIKEEDYDNVRILLNFLHGYSYIPTPQNLHALIRLAIMYEYQEFLDHLVRHLPNLLRVENLKYYLAWLDNKAIAQPVYKFMAKNWAIIQKEQIEVYNALSKDQVSEILMQLLPSTSPPNMANSQTMEPPEKKQKTS